MCCPECECGLDDNGDCACTIEYDSYDDQEDCGKAWEEYDDGGYCVIIPAVDN
jgi:hypothetical protein